VHDRRRRASDLSGAVAHEVHECEEVVEGILRRLALRDVVAALVDEDRGGVVGQHDLVDELVRVVPGRAAEAALDHVPGSEVAREMLPQAHARAAEEHDPASGLRIERVLAHPAVDQRLVGALGRARERERREGDERSRGAGDRTDCLHEHAASNGCLGVVARPDRNRPAAF
jgi:hypothetical protein